MKRCRRNLRRHTGMYELSPDSEQQLYYNETDKNGPDAAVTTRRRKRNFSNREMDALLSAIAKRRDAVLFSVSGGPKWALAWNEIRDIVSAVDGVDRTVTDLRRKWSYLKCEPMTTNRPDKDRISRAVLDIIIGRVETESFLHRLASQQTSERSLSPQPSTSSDHSGSNVQTNHQPNVPVTPSSSPPSEPQQASEVTLPNHQPNVAVTPTSSPPSEPQQASEVTLRWESYCSKMQSYFPHLLKNGQFADVTLAADDQFINCHKFMLSARSSYFHELLTNSPYPNPIITIEDVSFRDLKDLVTFMYHGEVRVPKDRLPGLHQAAKALKIQDFSRNPSDKEATHHSGAEDTQPPPEPPVPRKTQFPKSIALDIIHNNLKIKYQNTSVPDPQRPAQNNRTEAAPTSSNSELCHKEIKVELVDIFG